MTFPFDIEIIYEDDHVCAVNKPAGLVVHADGKKNEPTLAEWFQETHPTVVNVGEPWKTPEGVVVPRPGIVHRLDRETSGVLVMAKTEQSFEYMKQLFQERKIVKVYHAFVYGVPKEQEGVIERPIGKSRSDFRKWSAEHGARGALREAVTQFKVLKRGEGVALLEVIPKTGRTHQIRVHLKAIGHPVVGDSLYSKHKDSFGFSRLALHAKSLSFTDVTGVRLVLEAPYPQDFIRAMGSLF